MTKSANDILESKTPEEYIDRSLKARISPAAKAKLARLWMESTGFGKEDILRARNRHPYWKRKKMEGSTERTRRRLSEHNYSGGASVQWDQTLVTKFLGLNHKRADGRYEHKDWQLAERFDATIPSIQYMRRKLSKVNFLLGLRASQGEVVEYLLRAESVLSRGRKAVEELKSVKAKASPKVKAKAKKSAAKTTAKPATKPAVNAAPKAVKSKVASKKPAAKKASPGKAAPGKARNQARKR